MPSFPVGGENDYVATCQQCWKFNCTEGLKDSDTALWGTTPLKPVGNPIVVLNRYNP